MTTKKILLIGLSPTTTEDGIRSWLGGYGQVRQVEFVRDGDVQAPIAMIEMDISAGQAFFIESRICNYWHEGSLVTARLLTH